MAILTKTFTFTSGLDGWVTSGTTNHIGTDGSPDLGCLYVQAVGRNTTVTPSITWSGTYQSLGLPTDATITGLTASLYYKQNITGAVNDMYWDLWYSGTNNLITSPNDFTTIAWNLRTGTGITGLSIPSANTLDLTLDGYMRCANDKLANLEMFWDTIAIDIEYTTPFAIPTVTTSAATSITSTGATLNGELTSLGDATSVDVFFQWREVGAGTWNSTTKQTLSATGLFNEAITGLTSGVDYEFQTVLEYQNSGLQTVYGSTLSFQTALVYFTLSASVSGSGGIEMDGTPLTLPYSQSIVAGTKILEAVPDQYNEFVKWTVDSVDNLTNPLSLNLDADKTVVAYFQGQNAYIVENYVEAPPSDFLYVGGPQYNSLTTHKLSTINGSGTGGWSVDYGSSVFAVTVDDEGNVYTGGNFTGINPDFWELIKYNHLGEILWKARATTDGIVYAIAVDIEGNVYAAGKDNYGADNIAKFNSSGEQLWTRNHGATVRAIAVDKDGDVYVGGDASSTILFRKYDTNGNLLFSKGTADGINLTSIRGVAVDLDKNIYICGIPTTAGVSDDIYKLNPDGSIAWSAMYGAQVNAIAVDGQGNVYAGGPSSPLKKYSSTGALLDSITTVVIDYRAIVADELGDIFVCGTDGSTSGRLQKIRSSGTNIWNVQGPYQIYAMAVDPGLYGAGFWSKWEPIATLPLETTTYKDSSAFTIGTGYDYRLLKVENGVVVTPPTLSGELELVDAPASIRLNWGGAT